MDPRFQSLIVSDDLISIRNTLEKVTQTQADNQNPKKGEIESKSSTAEKAVGLSSLFSAFRSTVKPKTPKNRIDIEIRSYIEDVNLDMNQCPLTWWSECDYLYPNLKQYVEHYFCVLSFVDDMHRLSLQEQILLEKKFEAIASDVDRQQYWLHLNSL